jgi:hypothetical protein
MRIIILGMFASCFGLSTISAAIAAESEEGAQCLIVDPSLPGLPSDFCKANKCSYTAKVCFWTVSPNHQGSSLPKEFEDCTTPQAKISCTADGWCLHWAAKCTVQRPYKP